jgi:hypothetical protein
MLKAYIMLMNSIVAYLLTILHYNKFLIRLITVYSKQKSLIIYFYDIMNQIILRYLLSEFSFYLNLVQT